MRRFISATVIVAFLAACSNSEVLAPSPSAKLASATVLLGLNTSEPVRISEFHYDNVNGDTNEWIEVSGPGNMSLNGYSIVLYNGADGLSYSTRFLGGNIPLICSGRGVVLVMYAINGIQNDSPDGIALIAPDNSVIEFLSYEGSFTAVNGPAAGMTSVDIGVFETGNEPASPVTSLWRNGASTFWSGPSQNSFGTCNDNIEPPPASSVEVTPSSATILVGATQQFTGVAFNASHQPIVNATISWSSTNPSIATVGSSGLATGVAPGDVMIIASADGQADTAQFHVDPATRPPTAVVNGPFTGVEASPVSMSGAASTDPDAGDVLSFSWDFGDGQASAGVDVSHVYAQDGVYNVQLTVTDSYGLTSTVTTTATISNVAPVIDPFAGAVLLPGEAYTSSGSFTDPGADSWTATVDYGDGSGVVALPLAGKTFSLSHVYASAGVFTVTVRVSDDDATSSRAQTVTVSTVGRGVTDALALLSQLVADGKIDQPNANPVREALEGALAKLADGKMDLVVSQLETALRHLDAAVTVGKISAADASPLRTQILRILQSLGLSGFSSQGKTKAGD
jgi:PKD repeat protein